MMEKQEGLKHLFLLMYIYTHIAGELCHTYSQILLAFRSSGDGCITYHEINASNELFQPVCQFMILDTYYMCRAQAKISGSIAFKNEEIVPLSAIPTLNVQT